MRVGFKIIHPPRNSSSPSIAPSAMKLSSPRLNSSGTWTATYVIVAGETCIAQHAKAGRHAVVMEPAHYAGLLRPGTRRLADAPQWDPAYHALGAVEVRDLAIYETLSGIGGGQ